LNLSYLIYQVFPYLPISKKQIKSTQQTEEPSIKLLVGNVYQYNREFQKLNVQIESESPDIVLLVETDKWWKDQCITHFGKDFPEQTLIDKENTYGMLLFSKLPLSNTQVRYLIDEEIPSITTQVELKGGQLIKLFALHPVPPVPTQNLYSTDRDAEILLIGKEAKKEKLPVIVAGDLNDVAWSYTTNLFQKISGLLDPRRGRGFYSTFHAQKPLFRWPLDHIFCSTHFRLQNMKRLKDIGSDHFPIMVQLHLAPTKDKSDQLHATEEERNDAKEKIENGKNNH
jgi:endonuclease/exonuclease/phosphatase (EEP) superfamily protein YafD